MDKLYDKMIVSITELTDLVAQCGKVAGMAANIIQKNYVEAPSKESQKEEASPDPKEEASADPKKEDSSEEEILPGIVVKKYPTKPFEMVIE